VAQKLGVPYTREPIAGLSRARNAALAATARTRWVAFTDDDCRPESNWLRELVRELQDTNCRCVTGLVLPAQLENSAEIAFEIYGGLGRGFTPITYDPGFITRSRTAPAHTWRIGAGANMLLDADLVSELGGYDEDMGPGGVGGCGEDTDIFYQILRRGHTIHYNPRAIVHHYHRSSPAALRKQILSYAIGHSAYHTRCFFKYGDYRSVIHVCWHLPRWFYKNFRRCLHGRTKYPISLIGLEIRGTVRGVVDYSTVKLKKMLKNGIGHVASRLKMRAPKPQKADEKLMSYGDVSIQKSARVA
jgi:GT2 family glycosyltransferase